jgi:hypothetical protein
MYKKYTIKKEREITNQASIQTFVSAKDKDPLAAFSSTVMRIKVITGLFVN